MGLEKLVLKKEQMIGYFIADQQSDFYQTKRFRDVLQFVQSNPNHFVLKEKDTRQGLRLLLKSMNVKDVKQAYSLFKPIAKEVVEV
ncbi:MAG: hypothetical protein L0J45_06175, partial [Psychroflexus sp.]|nr:hypothetical protein [Psychroflexus sp.]